MTGLKILLGHADDEGSYFVSILRNEFNLDRQLLITVSSLMLQHMGFNETTSNVVTTHYRNVSVPEN